ncbi:unnamed protein product [Callosobruchus maculatus]|uniref:DDE Tnp4 domain-containing protein n=1 Tax=Callosobruchus maculatus TaxID=64391 RepID=A0A653D758_CALMS|nr:unnamed protein product [Callosobruchus maculatus]
MCSKKDILALMIIAEVCCEDEAESKTRKPRKWVKDWFLEKERFSNEKLVRHLKGSEPIDYKNYSRMTCATFDELLYKVAPFITKQDTLMRDAISAETRLNITLRYLAEGNDFEDLKFFYAVSPQAIGKIVIETCQAIIHVLQGCIKLPKTPDEWRKEAELFEQVSGFPNCIGAIDAKHVEIKKPAHSGSFYFNYKKTFSIVLMAVVNANLEFLMVDVGQNGRVSDGGVFSNTTFAKLLSEGNLQIPQSRVVVPGEESLPYVFVADDAFALTKNILKPYTGYHLTRQQEHFNAKLSSARVKVENVFGILANRFQVLLKPINLCPKKATIIVLTCCYLHNFLRQKDTPDSVNTTGSNGQSQGDGSNMLPLEPTHARNSTNLAKRTRDAFCNVINHNNNTNQ